MKSKIKSGWNHLTSLRPNTKMIPVKAFGFFLNFGTLAIFPYFTLQMQDVGLSFGDISIILGVIPIFTFISGPISGKLQKYCLGDYLFSFYNSIYPNFKVTLVIELGTGQF